MILAITLGHNSSAIGFTNDGKIIAGYEEQRFGRLKSTANFPINSISTIINLYKSREDVDLKAEKNYLYISHWYDNFDFYMDEVSPIKEQRYDKKFISRLILEYGFEIDSLNQNFTHHDAHAYAARMFFDAHNSVENEKSHILVVDGFGNRQQVISIYESDGDKITLLERYYGYKSSLGLLYQYATSFVGMKENEDEYKFLGYESNISKFLDSNQIQKLNQYSRDFSDKIYNRILLSTIKNIDEINYDEKYINLEELEATKQYMYDEFHLVLDSIENSKLLEDVFAVRTIIGYFIQYTVEHVLSKLIEKFNVSNLIVAGGVFYNVKVNNALLQGVNKFCAYPLAGDQGCGIGFLKKHHNIKYLDFNGLLIGIRQFQLQKQVNVKSIIDIELKKMNQFSQKMRNNILKNIVFTKNKKDLISFCNKKLQKNEIVQVVSGNMEFGPRALCNTSTLSLPHAENVEIINSLNKRNTVMPMAPVCLSKNLIYLFNPEQFKKVVGSLSYMILTLRYVKGVNIELYRGVMHNHPTEKYYTGRPQVITNQDHYVYSVLQYLDQKYGYKEIINTSYNIHGTPIVFDKLDAIRDFVFQFVQIKKLKIKKNIYLIVDQS